MIKSFKKLIALSALAASSVTLAQTDLTMYYPVAVGGPLTKIVDGMIETFEKKNPDINVNAIYAGNYNDARIKALAALKSGKPAQLSVMFSIDIHELMDLDAIVPFDEVISANDKDWLNSFYPALMENSQVDGKTYGIPFQRSTIVMYYNKDMFRQAGLDPNKPPKTWKEFVAVGKKLTKKENGKVTQWGAMIPSNGYPYWMFAALAKQNDEVLMNQAGTQTYFNNKGVVNALEYWVDLGKKHHIMPEGVIEWGTLRQNFLDQKTAIMWHSTGNLTTVKKNAKFDYGVAMLPGNKSLGSPTGGGNFYIFKQSSKEEKQAALKLVKFMTAPEQAAQWSMDTGYMGVSQAAYETAKLKQYVNDFPPAAVARNQLVHATAELSTHEAGRVRKLLDDAIQSALSGQASPKNALNSAQKQAKRVLRKYR